MSETRWSGIAAIVVGVLMSAWQIYEVNGGERETRHVPPTPCAS